MTRKILASPAAVGSAFAISGVDATASHSDAANTKIKPRTNFGKRCQISDGFARSGPLSMWLVQM
jgi:hypothetical protein